MYSRTIQSIFVAGAILFSLPAGAQVYYGGVKSPEKTKAGDAQKATLKYDPHDLSGMWARFGTREGRGDNQGGAPFPEAGDTGFGRDVPALTAEGQKIEITVPLLAAA